MPRDEAAARRESSGEIETWLRVPYPQRARACRSSRFSGEIGACVSGRGVPGVDIDSRDTRGAVSFGRLSRGDAAVGISGRGVGCEVLGRLACVEVGT